jgi:CBS domain containing-hemolysin-like protein
MVPLNQVHSVPVRCDRAMLLNRLRRHAHTRLPVWDDTGSNIVGFINVYEVLDSDEEFDNLKGFLKPMRELDAATPVIDAIETMRGDDLKMVLVMRARRGGRQTPIGIVTMKDLVEELLGELAEW